MTSRPSQADPEQADEEHEHILAPWEPYLGGADKQWRECTFRSCGFSETRPVPAHEASEVSNHVLESEKVGHDSCRTCTDVKPTPTYFDTALGTNHERSNCCAAPVTVGGEGITHYYVCSACHEGCDAIFTRHLVNNKVKDEVTQTWPAKITCPRCGSHDHACFPSHDLDPFSGLSCALVLVYSLVMTVILIGLLIYSITK